jgi:hypothetical protein
MNGFFPSKVDPDMLETIGEEDSIMEAAFMSKELCLPKFSIWNYIQK